MRSTGDLESIKEGLMSFSSVAADVCYPDRLLASSLWSRPTVFSSQKSQ